MRALSRISRQSKTPWWTVSVAVATAVIAAAVTPAGSATADMGPAVSSTIVQSTDFDGAADFEAIDGVLHPDGSTYYALVADVTAKTSRLLLIDTATNTLTASLKLTDSSGGNTLARFISIQPNGARLWVSFDETSDGMALISTTNPDLNNDGFAELFFLAKILGSEINRPGPVDFNANGSRAFFAMDTGNRSINHYIDASLANPIGQTRIESSVEELWESVAVVGSSVYGVKPGTVTKWRPGSSSGRTLLSLSEVTTATSRPDEGEVWVTRTNSNLVERITVSSNDNITAEERSSFFVRGPREVAFARDAAAAVVLGEDSSGNPGRFSLVSTNPTQRIDLIDVNSLPTHPVGLSVKPDASVAYALYTDSAQSATHLLAVETDFLNRETPADAPTLEFAGTVADGAVCGGETLSVKEGALAGDGTTLLTIETDAATTSAVRLIDLTTLITRDSCLTGVSSGGGGPLSFYAAVDPSGEYLWALDSRSGSAGVAVWAVESLTSPNSGSPQDDTYYGGETPRGLAFRPYTGSGPIEAYITVRSNTQNQVRRVVFSGSLTQSFTVPLNGSPDKVATSSAHVFASVANNIQAIPYEVFGGSGSLGTYSMTAPATSLTVSPDDSELWVTVGSESRIVVLNTSDLTKKAEITSYLANPQAVAFHPTDGTAIVADANGVKVFDADSKNYLTGYNIKSEQSLSADINVRSIVVSAAGNKVALVDINDGTYVVNYEVATPSTQSSEDTDEPLSDPSPQTPTSPSSPSTLTPPDSASPTNDTSEAQQKSAEETVEADSQESSDGELDPSQEGEFSGTAEPNELAAPPSQGPIPPWLIATSIGALFLLGAGASALWWRGRRA